MIRHCEKNIKTSKSSEKQETVIDKIIASLVNSKRIVVSLSALVGAIVSFFTILNPMFSGEKSASTIVQVNNMIEMSNAQQNIVKDSRNQEIQKKTPATSGLILTNEEIIEIKKASNYCKVGLYSQAFRKYEHIAEKFLNDSKADLKLLKRARKQIEHRNQSAATYYEAFFKPFYNTTE